MQGESERQWKKNEQESVQHFSPQNILLRSFWKVHVAVVQDNSKEMYKKSLLHVQSSFFAN